MFRSDLRDKTAHPVVSIFGIIFHGSMLFLMPFVVGGVAATFLEVSQVSETLGQLSGFALVVIAPIFVMQAVGVVLKTWREAAFLRRSRLLSARTVLDAAYRNVRILTPRGYLVLGTGLLFVLASLGFKFASLGVMSVASLLLFYGVTGTAVFMSSFLVRSFESSLQRKEAGIRREFHPAVARCGDPVTETFHLRRVPIMPGFFLAIQDELPTRLATETRHVVPPKARSTPVEASLQVRTTPRGTYQAGPARVWYSDLLGLTRVNVASLAVAQLKVLPAIRPVEILEPPKSPLQEPDILTRPDRFPTEDYFRFREYHAGDDTRRLHWKLSMRVGQMQVRLPETREIDAKKVLIALDTYAPAGWLAHTAVIDDLLDGLVDVWVSLASQLIAQGEKVSLVAAVQDERGKVRQEMIACNQGNRPAWLDAGARAAWQSEREVFSLFEAEELAELDHMIILTSRLEPPGAVTLPGKAVSWIYLHPGDTIGPEPPGDYELWMNWQDLPKMTGFQRFLRWVQLPHAPGSDENGLLHRLKHLQRRRRLRSHRAMIRRHVLRAGEQAFGALIARGDVVYRMQLLGDRYRLVGISGGADGPTREVPPAPTLEERHRPMSYGPPPGAGDGTPYARGGA